MRARGLAALFGTVAASAALMVGGSVAAQARPLHTMLSGRYVEPPTTAQCLATVGIACYSPLQFQHAYNMNTLYGAGLTGAGQTIAIVDSFGSPTIESDLKIFDKAYGLPDPPSFKIIQPAGPVPAFDRGNSTVVGWGVETSLDVEYAHSMAPGANNLLVETPVAETEGVTGFPQIVQAENFVINNGLASVISQSFGATEPTFPNPQSLLALRGAFENAAAHGVSVLAASGDAGATDATIGSGFFPFRAVGWPSSDPLVTSVGGTQLHLDENGVRLAPDNVWNDTALFGSPAAGGGGVSTVFARPFYQDSLASIVGAARGAPDVSMTAAVNGGANVYMGFSGEGLPAPGWYIIGGTSEATPLFSGVVAIADQKAGHPLGLLNPALYKLGDAAGSPLVDVTAGNNTVTFTQEDTTITVSGFDGVPGYDLASGLGTPNGAALVDALG